MSGICAALRLDGRPESGEDLSRVLAGLAARGPDGARLTTEGPVALGHALNATTPEAASEPMPFRHPETGCLLTADVRLDNREDLAASLGINLWERIVGDGELILAAYLKWGPDCPLYLLGDFAFVLWDPRHHRLFAARDRVGMRQLIYHFAPGKLFACATDACALLAHPDVPLRVNEGRFADHLQNMEAFDETSTFYLDLHRLPPAHTLTIAGGQMALRRYWRLEPAPVVYRPSDADYEAAFLEVFTQAVRPRLRSAGRLGSMLSGGLDSGSVVAVAANLLRQAGAPPLRTISAIDTRPTCEESAAIRKAMAMPHLAPQVVSTAAPEEFRDDVNAVIRNCGEPFDAHMAMVMAVCAKARANGINVMLDGVGGDTTLNPGNVVLWHIEAGRYREAWQEALADERHWGHFMPARQNFAALLRRHFVPVPLRRAWYRVKLGLRLDKPDNPMLLDKAFAERIRFADRQRQFRARVGVADTVSPETRVQRMLHPYIIAARERYDRVAGAFGIEPRDPFLDPRVLEFCRTLPVDQIKRDGWHKIILRRSMAGLMDEALLWRTGRTHVGGWFIAACDSRKPADYGLLRDHPVASYVDARVLDALLASEDEDFALASLTEINYLGYWISGIAVARGDGD